MGIRMTVAAGVALTCALLTGLAAQTPQLADVANNPFASNPDAIPQGAALFDRTCSGCHGPGATGGRGPALANGVFQHGGSDNEIFATIKSGVPGTQMPSFSTLPSDDVWRLVTYIKSLSGQLGGQGKITGDAKAGEQVFFGKGGCASCHEVDGRGPDLASDLSAEGTKPAGAIKTGVLHQFRRRFGPAPHFADVTTADGKTVHGLVRNDDAFYIQLETMDGRWSVFDKKDVKTIAPAGNAWPGDVEARLSPADIDNVVAYLAGHKKRDLAQTAMANPAPVLPYAGIVHPATGDWTTYWGDYEGTHFSTLDQITAANVNQLQAKWIAPLSGTYATEATPVVVDGVMYAAGGSGDVFAYDARTGLQIWAFHRKQDIKNPYQNNPNNKGVAVLDGRVFVGTLDDLLIAIDAHTGRELWETRTDDTLAGYQLTGAPLAVDGKIIMGMSGGELGVRGYLDAYDPATGKRLWRTYTVPGPGEKGNETWPGDSWKTGGAPTWLTGSYDVDQHLLIWGTGNPAPDYNAESRKGDNLYSDSVLAIDPDTGKIKWHYQFTPNDDHDWDSTEDYVLTDLAVDGKERKVILHADRNGYFYVLDGKDGHLLLAKPFVHTNWNNGFDAKGRPKVNPATVATPAGVVVFPAVGGTNFQAPTYDAKNGLFILEYVSSQGFAQSAPVTYEKGKQFLGRGVGGGPAPLSPDQGIEAIDAKTGNIVWKFPMVRVGLSSGLVGTAGGVIFAASAEGQLLALDEKTGKPLWHFRVNGPVNSSPMTYMAGGRQFIAITAATQLLSFGLPDH
ncbi:MAG TPA: PQQ-dependent dehydrogenase, methanol/ethanol family [Rhizomicrobium sp.]|nr:PQQ-dependent dehydrogenase, methanol/ethanol family [Rhizomicrobium sp.]